MSTQVRNPTPPPRRRKTDWPLRRIIEIGGAVTVLWGGWTFLAAAFGARWASKDELRVVRIRQDSIISRMDSSRAIDNRRFLALENRADRTDVVHTLIPASLRLQCLQLRRDRSMSLAAEASMPCDSLLRR